MRTLLDWLTAAVILALLGWLLFAQTAPGP
jgi:hypothetical protein